MAGIFGIWQWVIVLVIIILLFGGGGKLSRLMADFGRGLRALKTNLSEEDDAKKNKPDDEKTKK